jgi:hypothetical protein
VSVGSVSGTASVRTTVRAGGMSVTVFTAGVRIDRCFQLVEAVCSCNCQGRGGEGQQVTPTSSSLSGSEFCLFLRPAYDQAGAVPCLSLCLLTYISPTCAPRHVTEFWKLRYERYEREYAMHIPTPSSTLMMT